MTERLLTVQEVAERLQLHPRTVRRAIAGGGLRAFEVAGGAWRVAEDDLQAWLEARANKPRAVPSVPAAAPLQLAAGARPHARRGGGSGVLAVAPGMGRVG